MHSQSRSSPGGRVHLRRLRVIAPICALVVVACFTASIRRPVRANSLLEDGRQETQLLSTASPRHVHPRRGAMSKQVKLIKWAERHGLPKSLANNPKDRSKVKHIIARMKADLVVERIQAQMKKDDSTVTGIIHGSDPDAAGVGR